MKNILNQDLLEAEKELLKILPTQRVRTDELSRISYSYDASMIKAKPYGVIDIKDINELPALIKILNKYKVSFTPRCAGTNLTGGATNQKGGFIINLAGCDKICQIDTQKMTAVVEPGVVNIKLQEELERFGYFYPPDPASQKVSTIGGNIAENAGGARCIKYGVTLNNVVGLDVVLPDGNEARFSIDDQGPELINLFIGSEGTLGIIKKAYLRILPLPRFRAVIYAEFETLEKAVESVERIISEGIIPSALEAVDRTTLELTSKGTIEENIQGVVIAEIDGNSYDEISSQKEVIEKILKEYAIKLEFSDDPRRMEELFRIRKEAYPSLAKIAKNVLVEDGCVPRSNLTKAVKEIRQILKENKLTATLVFHAGDGNIHPNIIFDERDIKETNRIRRIASKILEVYLKYNGTVSAEHGVGVEKRGYVALQHDKEVIEILKNIKNAIDKNNISNPEKKIPLSLEIAKLKRKAHQILSPQIKELKEEIERRYTSKTESIIIGSSSKIKNTYNYQILSSANLKNLVELDKKNMTLTLESGVKMRVLDEFLQSEGFKTFNIDGTIGGFISTGQYHQIRDILLGMQVILSDGRVLNLGSKNIKDTSIYEIMRIFIGSQGTLGFITHVTIKLYKGNSPLILTKKELKKNITPLHKEIKKVFDPLNLFNPFLTKELYGYEA